MFILKKLYIDDNSDDTLSVYLHHFIDKTINDFTRMHHDDKNEHKLYLFSKPHNDMYITAYKIFLDNKFFGVGPRQFRNTCDEFSVSIYS